MKAPTLGRKMKRGTRVAPLMRNPRRAKVQTAPKLVQWKVTKQKTWDIGDGPWMWNGQKASRPEYITLIVLKKLGWHPKFQTDILGGRRIPGGQVLDILIEEAATPVYISVKGYYHEGAKANAEDSVKELLVMGEVPNVKVLTIWEKDIDQEGWLEDFLRREVGIRG